MFLFSTLLLSALAFYLVVNDVTATTANNCCPNGKKLVNVFQCSDESIPNVICDTHRLLWNMTAMNYTVDTDGNLDIQDATALIPKQV